MPHINITIDITEAQAEAVNRLRPARGRTTVLRMIEFLHAVGSEVDTVHVSAARGATGVRSRADRAASRTSTQDQRLDSIHRMLVRLVHPELAGLPNADDALAVLDFDVEEVQQDVDTIEI